MAPFVKTSDGTPIPLWMSSEPARLPAPSPVIDTGQDSDALIEERRARAAAPLERRDSRVTSASALAFLAACAALQLGFPGNRHPSVAILALLIAGYAVASKVEFEVGIGSAIPTQLVFVPMLFLLPPAMVPLCVAIGLLLGNAATYMKRQEHPERALVVVASSWNAVGGALVIALAGEPDAAWSVWPVLLAAVLAQFAFDFLGSATRAWVAFGIAPKAHVRLMAWVYGVDLALTPIALLTAIVAEEQPLALLVVLPLLALLAFLAQERRRRIDHALELGHAYRGTAFLLGDVIEADDEYTGNHSREVVSLTLAVADRLGLSARQRRSAELTALLHDVGKIRIPAEIINKPAALTAEERDGHQHAHDRGRADAGARRRPSRRGRRGSFVPATSAGTARAIRTGSPARTSRSWRASSAAATPTTR